MPTEADIQDLQLIAPLDFIANAGTKKPAAFRLTAYTGEPMRVDGFFDPVIVDLEGAEFAQDVTPVIADHDTTKRIGHTTKQEVTKSGIFAAGIVSSSMGIAKGFVEDAKAGFPFQCSIGAEVLQRYFVEAGDSVEVNGKVHDGPLVVAKKTLIRELSVTVLGADSKSSAIVASKNPISNKNQESDMPQELNSYRQKIQAEEQRLDEIRATFNDERFAGLNGVEFGNRRFSSLSEFKSHVIGDGNISAKDVKLTLLQARLSQETTLPMPNYNLYQNRPADSQVLEAAIADHVGLRMEGSYSEQAIEAGRYLGITSMMDALKLACQMNGKSVNWRDKDAVIQAAFSTADIPNVISNVANKSLEEAYRSFPSASRLVARRLSSDNFKTCTGLRLTGDIVLEQLPRYGELRHGDLTDQAFTFSVDTYAKMFGIDRRDLIDDDVSALDSVPKMLGRGAALAVEEAFWTLVLANTGSFFSAGNGNLVSGATSVLSIDGLALAVQKLLEQQDDRGKPINVVGRYVVVPPAGKAVADQIYTATTVNSVAAGTTDVRSDRIANANPFFGLYEPVVSPWIGANGLAGGSDASFYLFGSPNDVAAFGIAYLGGEDRPQVRQREMPAGKLGIVFEAVLDFGVCQIDHRGAVMSAGA